MTTINVNDTSFALLVSAINSTNAQPNSIINYTVTGTITLEAPLPTINQPTTILGNDCTINGANTYNLLTINTTSNVQLNNLIFSNEYAFDDCCGIRSTNANLILQDVIMQNCVSDYELLIDNGVCLNCQNGSLGIVTTADNLSGFNDNTINCNVTTGTNVPLSSLCISLTNCSLTIDNNFVTTFTGNSCNCTMILVLLVVSEQSIA